MANNSQKSIVKFTYLFHFVFDFAQYTTNFYKKKGFITNFFK